MKQFSKQQIALQRAEQGVLVNRSLTSESSNVQEVLANRRRTCSRTQKVNQSSTWELCRTEWKSTFYTTAYNRIKSKIEDGRCRRRRSRTGAAAAANETDNLVRALQARWVTCAGENQAKTGTAACGDLAAGEVSSRGVPPGEDLAVDKL
jgi:hypothetical protein